MILTVRISKAHKEVGSMESDELSFLTDLSKVSLTGTYNVWRIGDHVIILMELETCSIVPNKINGDGSPRNLVAHHSA